ncbi:ribonuclease P protein component 1 [Methanothermobacter sp.]|uniref:ribonuclease P protein component 1 n=1 Tax=Methanothermobacter sp. TaxID=1884223 RepID=UPI002620018A|nr:ribonuclease P protein component 1 [Methanothermobacter sp.]MDI9618720.1 ribonuclease P protein component 1 [Methanothermobacter sp.]
MITPHNIFRHELIGLSVRIARSVHRDIQGLAGRVVDETRNTLKIELEDGREVMIPKEIAVFHFRTPEGEVVEIDGGALIARPEERIKKKFRKP